MNEILFHYEKIDPTTWAYLASLLIIGLFFKFGRFWSVRNLDLLLLILLAPGLLLVSEGQKALAEAMAAVAAARQAHGCEATRCSEQPRLPRAWVTQNCQPLRTNCAAARRSSRSVSSGCW